MTSVDWGSNDLQLSMDDNINKFRQALNCKFLGHRLAMT